MLKEKAEQELKSIFPNLSASEAKKALNLGLNQEIPQASNDEREVLMQYKRQTSKEAKKFAKKSKKMDGKNEQSQIKEIVDFGKKELMIKFKAIVVNGLFLDKSKYNVSKLTDDDLAYYSVIALISMHSRRLEGGVLKFIDKFINELKIKVSV